MSQEAVESMRRSYEALNQALASGEDLLPLMAGLDPEIVIEMGAARRHVSRTRRVQAIP